MTVTNPKDIDCDAFIGKVCRFKPKHFPKVWFVLLGRNPSRHYPAYIALQSDGYLVGCGRYYREEIEEVK